MRIGAVPYMNGKPLIRGLESAAGVELICDVPSRLAAMLKNGEVAAGLVSSVACFLNPILQIVPGISISSVGPSESVKLFYRNGLESIRRVALDTGSLTSVLLAKIILRERYELLPEFVPMPPSLPEMLEACDAAVLIGDSTMRIPESLGIPALDLGGEWHRMTGLPFTFAVWAVNPALADMGLVYMLAESKKYGMGSLQEISESEAIRLGLPVDICYRYLSEIMNYELTDRHMDGLTLFREKAHRYGLAPTSHELEMYEPAEGRVLRK